MGDSVIHYDHNETVGPVGININITQLRSVSCVFTIKIGLDSIVSGQTFHTMCSLREL